MMPLGALLSLFLKNQNLPRENNLIVITSKQRKSSLALVIVTLLNNHCYGIHLYGNGYHDNSNYSNCCQSNGYRNRNRCHGNSRYNRNSKLIFTKSLFFM